MVLSEGQMSDYKGAAPMIDADRILYRQRHTIENVFGRLKDWRRIHNSPRQMRTYLHVRHLYRCRSHLLAIVNKS